MLKVCQEGFQVFLGMPKVPLGGFLILLEEDQNFPKEGSMGMLKVCKEGSQVFPKNAKSSLGKIISPLEG